MLFRTTAGLLLMAVAAATARGQTAEELLAQAQQMEKEGASHRAVKLYQTFLEKHKDHAQATEARYRLARCYDAIGLVDQAIAELKTVAAADVRSFRNKPEALYLLGKLYAGNRAYEEAAKVFEKMLAEGAGIYEDEVMNLTAGYYAILQKYEDAAAKYNILKRRSDSKLAEQASLKLSLLWLKAEKTDQAIEAIADFASAYPDNKQIPDLLLKAADLCRRQGKFDKTISICEQLRSRYPKTLEALAGNYLLGLCYRDRKEFKKAADALDQIGLVKDYQARGLAAEALVQSANIYYSDLRDVPASMKRYEEAAKLARESETERKTEILEQCYFRLGEYHFEQKNYTVALEYYTLLRNVSTRVNVFTRIMQCQEALGQTAGADVPVGEAEVELLRKRIADNPGTAIAADAEIFLLDRKFSESLRRKLAVAPLASEYARLLTAYPAEVLKAEHREPYIYAQIGTCLAQGTTREELVRAIAAFEKVLSCGGEENPYRITALENIVISAERLGDRQKAASASRQLFEISKAKLDAARDDKALEQRTLEYLRTWATRVEGGMIDSSIELCRRIIEEKGPLSDLSREARYYLGELLYLKRDFSAAAKTFQEFVSIYGPRQDARGEVKDAPWRPAKIDEKVEQVYTAAIRVAHAWYMQGHHQNMVAAYEWVVRNFPVGNRHMPEAQYWLAIELGKGTQGQTKEGKRKMADALWKNVVGPSMDFDDSKFLRTLHPWTGSSDERYAEAQKYVKPAILKAGQIWSELGDHDLAAGAFRTYLELYGGGEKRPAGKRPGAAAAARDENLDTARYALGREYIALKNYARMIEVYKPYLHGMRGDRFRVSALRLLGYHAAQAGQQDIAIEAYATLLDEYGENRVDARGNPIPLPPAMRLRQDKSGGWDGIRMPAGDLDLGEVRFALGLLYWRAEDWRQCVRTLQPFLDDPKLAKNKYRDRALYMAGQSCYRLYDYATGTKLIQTLVREYPRFEAVEEAYVNAARGCAETKNWSELDLLYQTFVREWPRSDYRPRMDLLAAVSHIGQNRADKGLAMLRSLAASDAYQDVRADAWYHLGINQTDPAKALEALEKSVQVFPRETSCLAAAKAAMKLGRWDRAAQLLDMVTRDFPRGNPAVLAEARSLLPSVQAALAKQKK